MLRVEHLSVSFPGRRRGLFSGPAAPVPAVQDVSFSIPTGKTVGLVGESGSGKTTIGRCLIKLQQPDAGRVLLEGKDLVPMSEAQFLPLRRDIQMIFQDPFGSLNPRLDLLAIIGEPLEIHFPKMPRRERAQRVAELLQKVGLSPDCMGRRPQEFSGGQRQRIGIARALAVAPKLIICDEPVSALDVSVQAQIVNLLQDLQEELGLSYLFIAHDLAVVQHLSDEVLVLHRGKIVEAATAEAIYAAPQHEYTKKLLASVPAVA
ncbi:MAG: ABC transporter ATP-binding protein [Verrucomicrobiales bacterium]|nr:ABC transporter ATP-binding protein [Verrucomicrobiales bacterium]